MEPNFKIVFTKKSTYGSREQCTGHGTHLKKAPLENAQNMLPKHALRKQYELKFNRSN